MKTCPINSGHRVLERNMAKHMKRCKKSAADLHKKNWKPNAKDETRIAEVPRHWEPLLPSGVQGPWWNSLLKQESVGVPVQGGERRREWEWEPELDEDLDTEGLSDGNVVEIEDDSLPPPKIDPGVPVCRICQLRNIEMVYNCGHTTCEACYKRITNGSCPFCRKCILQKIKIFF